MSERLIDLHTHTTYSDGSATPEELITRAASKGASAVAVTDHDTVSGLPRARAIAARAGVELINGIEISAEYAPGTMHILGYYIDDESEELRLRLAELKQARDDRNPEIARRLQAMGFGISYEEVAGLAGNEMVGRPHFARLMVERGYARDMQDAFDRFLAKGAAAYVEKKRLSPRAAIALIHDAGGAAVLAHPYQLKLPAIEDADRLVGTLAEMGLDGIEAVYSRHSEEQRELYARMAARWGLLVTGGSDYHGTYKPDIDIVKGLGDLAVPYELLGELKARAAQRASSRSRGTGSAAS
jgi:predicted metal-dependent phosphoesterase TrpH